MSIPVAHSPQYPFRGHWPVSKGRLAEMEGETLDLSHTTTVEERFAMMWQLAQDVYAIRGEPVSESPFSRLPGCLIRRRG